jgi:Domain of unknown function (DUF4345)
VHLFWLGFYSPFAVFNAKYGNPALLTVTIFPAGFVTGRIISLFAEGKPSPLLVFYMAAELIQAPVAYWAFRLPD